MRMSVHGLLNLNTNGFGMELDYYGGFTGAIPLPTIEDYFSYDIGVLYYDYPGASSQDKRGNDGTGGTEPEVWNS